MTTLLIRGGTIIRADGEEKKDIFIENGVIRSIGTVSEKADEEIDATGKILFPGLIDCHVHFREPGLTEKGDMQSESAAARAGGVTTVCDMPNTIPPVTTVAALADKVRRAEKLRNFDMRFFMGVTEPSHLLALRDIWIHSSAELTRLRKSCAGVKIYLDHSTGNQKIGGSVIDDVFKLCGELHIPLVAHCEDAEMNSDAAKANTKKTIEQHSVIRSEESEAKSIEYAIGLARKYMTPFHVAHLSTKQGIALVKKAKKEGLRVTCEVAPHHLFLSTDDYKRLGTLGKMNPPLRSKDHVEALWEGIREGTVDCISTDHAPHTLEEKQNANPLEAPSGVPGVETMLPLLLNTSRDKLSYTDIYRLCFENPNRIFGLGKSGIVEGASSDIVIVDPNAEWEIHGKDLHSKCGWTPYEGWKVRGKVNALQNT